MAQESLDIPHSMRKVYRRFERWRSAHGSLADSGAAWSYRPTETRVRRGRPRPGHGIDPR
jgi:hypothetical protein